MEHLLGLTEIVIKDSLEVITQKVMVAIFGWMEDSSKVFGRTIKCMEEEPLFGLMVENTKASIKIRKNKVMVNLVGLTVAPTKDSGVTANKMAEVCTATKKEWREPASGVVVKKLNGQSDQLMI